MDSSQSKGSDIARMIWIVGAPLIFTVGAFGNIMTMIVLSRKRNKPSSTSVFLSAKALFDIVVMVIMLPRWWIIYLTGIDVRHINNFVCKFQFFVNYFSGSIGSFLLAAVTIERAICTAKPYLVKNICTVNIAVIISIALALTACVIHGHMFFGMKLYEVTYKETSETISFPLDSNERSTNTCEFILDQYFDTKNDPVGEFRFKDYASALNSTTEECIDDLFVKIETNEKLTATKTIKVCWYDDPGYGQYFSGMHQILLAIIFTTILTIFFVGGLIIIKGLQKSRKLRKSMTNTNRQTSGNKPAFDDQARQITVSILFVNALFVLMGIPALIYLNGISAWIDEDTGMTEIQEIMWAVVNMLAYAKHAINFILYFLSGQRFRSQVKETFGCFKYPSAERSKSMPVNRLVSVASSYDLSLKKKPLTE
jgi:hypothetical protein